MMMKIKGDSRWACGRKELVVGVGSKHFLFELAADCQLQSRARGGVRSQPAADCFLPTADCSTGVLRP